MFKPHDIRYKHNFNFITHSQKSFYYFCMGSRKYRRFSHANLKRYSTVNRMFLRWTQTQHYQNEYESHFCEMHAYFVVKSCICMPTGFCLHQKNKRKSSERENKRLIVVVFTHASLRTLNKNSVIKNEMKSEVKLIWHTH